MNNRPLSPHIQVYKPQLTSVLSITHRGTGVFLALGLVPLVWWLMATVAGPQAFAQFNACMTSIVGRAFLFAWTFSLFYHLANGIRHLCWDAGRGFSMRAVYIGGWLVVAASMLLTVLTWLVVYRLL